MNTKLLSLLVAVLSISGFAFVIAPGMNGFNSNHGIQPDSLPAVVFTGNITILPDGQVYAVGTGSTTTPLSQSGNDYKLTGDVNATLTIERNGSNVDGNGFYIYNNSYSMGPLVNISQVNNVSVSNLKISSTSTGAVEIQNASHISLSDLNISTVFVGVIALANTYYVNVSNSLIDVLPVSGPSQNLADIGLGLGPGGTGFPQPTHLSAHNAIYNVTLSAYQPILGNVVIGSNYTSFKDSTIKNTTDLDYVLDAANNTLIKGINVNVSLAANAILVSPVVGGTLTNNTIMDNNIVISNTVSSAGNMNAVEFNSTGTVSGNRIYMNNEGGNDIGLITQGKNINVKNNEFILMHGNKSLKSVGLQTQGVNTSVSDNYFNLSGGNVSAIVELPAGTNFAQISNNNIYINGTNSSSAIVLNGSSQNVNNNSIFMYSGHKNSGITGYAQSPTNFSGLSVSDNSIVITNGTSLGISLNASTTIQNAEIQGNGVSFTNVSGGLAYLFSSLNDSMVSMNSFAFAGVNSSSGLFVYNSGNSTVFNNNISNGDYATGYEVSGSNNITFSQNYVNGFAGSFYFVNTVNSTFYGNTGNYSLGSLDIVNGDNLTLYHNNFMNSQDGVSISSSKNIVLNLSYPIGGNYWNTATSDQFSGPNQNIKGSDGINDTAFTAAPGFVDYYPLVKPWINPQAVFNEAGLLSGSSWSVTFNGQTKTSTGNSIVFDIVNGTYQNYSYAIHTVSGYKGGGQSGIFSYTGNNSFATSTTYIPKYVFNISETGLPTGASWNVSINGTLHTLTSSSYSIVALNGTTITYKAYNTSLYYASPVSGTLSIAGHNVTVNIVYTHWAYIVANFSQTGINLTINGKAVGTDVQLFNETVPAGTYHVVISGKGYVTKYNNFTLNGGQVMNVSTTLSPVKGSSSPLSLGPYVYVIVGVVAAAVVVSGAFFFLRRKN